MIFFKLYSITLPIIHILLFDKVQSRYVYLVKRAQRLLDLAKLN